jgi:uncharacterized protein
MVQGTARDLLVVLAIFGTVIFWEGKPLSSIGFRRLRVLDLSWAVVAYPFAVLSQALVSAALSAPAFGRVLPAPNVTQAFVELPLGILLVGAAVNSVYEETWRAFAIERVQTISGSVAVAATLSLVASVSTHVPFWGFRNALVIGGAQFVLVLLYISRRSLPACVVTHIIGDIYPTAIGPALSVQAASLRSWLRL